MSSVKHNRKLRGAALAFAAAAAIGGGVSAKGAVVFWNGGSSGNWSDSTQWSPNSNGTGGSVSASGNDVVFYASGGSGVTATVDVNSTASSLTFGNGQTFRSVSIIGTGATTLTLSGTANYMPSIFNSGPATNLGTVGIYYQSGFSTASISAPILLGSSQLWESDNTSRILTVSNVLLGSNVLTTGGAGSITFSGVVSGAGSLTLNGTGVVTLSGANTYTGDTKINQGTAVVNRIAGTNTNFGNSSNAITLGDATHAGTISYTGTNVTFTRGLSINAGGGEFDTSNNGSVTISTGGITTAGQFTVGGAGTTTIASAITGAGSLWKDDAGVLILSGANSYAGNTTVNAGSLRLGAANVIPGGAGAGNVTVVGTIDLRGNSLSINGLSGAGTIDNLGSSGSTPILTVGNNDATSTFSGVITDSTGTVSLVKTGNGSLTLSGSNGYSGTTTLNGGTLIAVSNTALGGSSLRITSGTLDIADNSGFTAYNTTVAGTATILTDRATSGSGVNQTLGTLALNGSLTVDKGIHDTSGTGTLTFGAVTLSGGAGSINTNAGVLTILSSGVTGTAQNLSIGGAGNASISGSISTTTGGLYKSGTGSLTLSGSSTFTGPVNIYNGTVIATSDISGTSNIGNGSSAVVLGDASNTGVLSYLGNSSTFTRGLSIGAGGGEFDTSTTGSVTMSTGAVTTAGVFTIGGGGTTTLSSGISGAGSLERAASGLLILSGTNTYAGGTTIDSGGSIRTQAANVIPYGASVGDLMVNGLLTLNAFSQSVNGLSGTGTITNQVAGTPSLTVGYNNATSTFGGTIANALGTLAINKTGTGSLTLSGVDTYTGNTNILDGTLIVKNSSAIATGSTIVNSATLAIAPGISFSHFVNWNPGSTLAGSGTFTQGGSFSVPNLSPGLNGIGTLTVANSLTVSGTTFIDIGAPGTSDLTKVTGTLNLGTSGITLNDAGGGAPGAYKIFTYSSGTLGGTPTVSSSTLGTDHFKVVDGGAGTGSTNGVFVDVYRLGAANTLTTPIDLGMIHAGGTFGTSTLSLQNTATADNFSEGLNASFGTGTGGVFGSGSVANLAAQGTSNALSVGIAGAQNTGGTVSGTIAVNLASNGSSTSGAGNTSLGSQTIAVSGFVYTGNGVWNTNGNGNWGSFAAWTAAGGAPGLDGALSANDTATFGGALTSGSATVTLNGVSPHLAGLTFSSNGSYTIDRSGSETLTFDHGSNTANVDVTGHHTINVPVVLLSNLAVNTVGTNSSLTVNGDISEFGGSRSFAKTGTGVLNLNGTNTYSGNTAVNGGTLNVNGSIAGNVIVNGATLGGTGVIHGSTELQAGALLNPNGIGTTGVIQLTSLTLDDGSTVQLDLGNASAYDQVQLTSIAKAAGATNTTLDVVDLFGNQGMPLHVNDTFQLFSTGIGSAFTNIDLPSGYTWDTSKLATEGKITVLTATVPEPGPFVLGMLALASVSALKLRKKKAAGLDAAAI